MRVLLTLTTKRGKSGVAVSAFPPPHSLLSSFIPSLSTDPPLASLLLDPKGCPDGEILQHLELVPLGKGRGRGRTDSHHAPPLQCPCRAGLRAPKCPESACKDIIYTQPLYFTGQHLDAASTSRHPVGKDLHVLPSCLSFPKPTASAIATPPHPGHYAAVFLSTSFTSKPGPCPLQSGFCSPGHHAASTQPQLRCPLTRPHLSDQPSSPPSSRDSRAKVCGVHIYPANQSLQALPRVSPSEESRPRQPP